MKKETNYGITKFLKRNNIGISSKAILWTYILGHTEHIQDSTPYPHDNADFNRCYLLVKDCPECFKAIKKLAKEYEQWKNILKFWEELVYIFNNGNEPYSTRNIDFYNFYKAVINVKYGNKNYQDKYNERQKLGREIYKKYGFKGKRLPKAPISD